jgi:hypothetical protein
MINPFRTKIAYICTSTKNYRIEAPFLGQIRIIPQKLSGLNGYHIEYLIVDENVPVHNDTKINLISTPYVPSISAYFAKGTKFKVKKKCNLKKN